MADEFYRLSFDAHIQVEKVLRPKWWQIWKREQITQSMEWCRHSLVLREDEGKLLLKHDLLHTVSPIWRLVFKAASGADVANIANVQIEELHRNQHNLVASEYVSTEGID